jgi:5'-nucleotidase
MTCSVRALACSIVLLSVPLAPVLAQPPAPDRPAILLSNDDGYDAPGLQALIQAFAGAADLYVAAPAQNQTGKGHGLTMLEAIVVRQRSTAGVTLGLAIDATPATCVRLALERYLPERPDLVVSGINRGENLGTSVYVSGTLGAAREAAFSGLPAIAVSIAGNRPEDYAATAAFVRQLADDLRERGLLRPGFFLNVNAPSGTPRGVAVTRLSVRPSHQVYDCTPPAKERAACFAGYRQETSDEAGTDVGEFYRGFITLTPLLLDVTDVRAMDPLRALERRPAPAGPGR